MIAGKTKAKLKPGQNILSSASYITKYEHNFGVCYLTEYFNGGGNWLPRCDVNKIDCVTTQ